MNIHEVTERVRQLIEAEAGASINVTRDYDPSLPEFNADAPIQAVLNIARNAWEASPSGCALTLKTRSRRQYTLNGQRLASLLLEIIDDGPGFQRSDVLDLRHW